MTILFFCNLNTGKLGAFENLLLEIGRRLTAGGDRLVVIFGAPPFGPVPEALKEAGISWDYIKGWAGEAGHPRAWRFVLPALAAIRRFQPELVAVHFGNEFPTLVAALMSKCFMKRSPIWVWHQRQQIEDPSFITRRLSRIRTLGLVVHHYVVSYEGGRKSLQARNVKPEKITRIYNAVPEYVSGRSPGWLKQELCLTADAVVAVNVGWLVPRKRIDISIRAFAKVAQKLPNSHLLVVGDGSERGALEAKVRALGMETRIHFLGARNDVRDILSQADCLVHSSIAETCTNVVLESMAAGIPAVIMNAGAATEQIDDGVSGYVVGAHDEQALADRLEEVMSNSMIRKTMGSAALQKWKTPFNLDVTAAEHADLYRHLLGKVCLSRRPIKTLSLCNLIPLKMGAFERLLAAIGQEFKNAGDEFVVTLSGKPIEPVAELLRTKHVRWEVVDGWAYGPDKVNAWGFVVPALRLLRRENPDVVIVNFGNELPLLVTVLLARLMGMGKVKWIWQQHQQIKDPGWIEKRLSRLRLLNLSVDHFVAVYRGGFESLRKRGIPADKITIIHNAVTPYTPSQPKGWLRKELGIPPDEILMVTIGSLIPRKRIDFLLRACAPLRAEGSVVGCQVDQLLNEQLVGSPLTTQQLDNLTTKLPPWRLLIIGEGPDREQLESLSRDLGIAHQVHFLGLRNDIREMLPECDLYVHASSAETCTYALTESMAAGIPAVVLDAGAAKEQIQDEVSGYVLDAVDAEVFASRVRELMENMEKRAEMGRAAEARWRENFTMDVSASAYHHLYRRLGAREGKG